MQPTPARLLIMALAASCLGPLAAAGQGSPAPALRLNPGDRIVYIGNTFAERMQLFPHLETALTLRFAADSITFRNLGWSADEVALQPRPLNFGDLDTHLSEQRPDVILAFFGMNESFAGAAGLEKFQADLAGLLRRMSSKHYNGRSPPRLVLVSPIAHEHVARVPLDPGQHNRDLAAYTETMRRTALEAGALFVDLFSPTRSLMEDPALGDLTINGIHLDDRGYRIVSRLLLSALGLGEAGPPPAGSLAGDACGALPRSRELVALEKAIQDKNQLFFYRWRPVNGEYVYGRRREPFGVVNFPGEMKQLEEMIRAREREIFRLARAASTGASRSRGGCAVVRTADGAVQRTGFPRPEPSEIR